MVLFRGDIKCKSLQRRTTISVILPADNIHFLLIDSDIPQMEETIKNSKEGLGLNALEVSVSIVQTWKISWRRAIITSLFRKLWLSG